MSGILADSDNDGREFGPDRWGRQRLLNWSACFTIILCVHIGVLWTALHWTPRDQSVPPAPPPAMMIDLAPLPAAPLAPPEKMAPGPGQPVSQPPPKPEMQLHLPAAPPSPAPQIAAPVPPKVKSKPIRDYRPTLRPVLKPIPDQRPPAPATSAPPQLAAPPAPAAAPAPANSPAISPNAAVSWQASLLGRLEQFKRYPYEAQSNHEEGIAYLHFTMDRKGKVLSAAIVKSSGYDVLDQETLALVFRAEPLPPPPPGIPGDPIELTVPVQFFLHQ